MFQTHCKNVPKYLLPFFISDIVYLQNIENNYYLFRAEFMQETLVVLSTQMFLFSYLQYCKDYFLNEI